MSSDIAISVKNVSKCYKIYDRPQDRLKQSLWRGRKQFYREFWALRDVSFEVKKGETIGIIGRNGSGKSTLLQIIAGTLTPSSGEVQVNGRIAALLELGSGFNPEFTGRENVYMNGAILGISREEMERRFDDIAAFADIGEFIDQPVKTYSSGMFVRLAFSIAIHANPDILIVDEALAVGDVFFQRKCFAKIEELNKIGCTLIYVTHELGNLKQIVRRGLLMNGGNLIYDGEPVDVVNKFYQLMYHTDKSEKINQKYNIETGSNTQKNRESIVLMDRVRYGNKQAVISEVLLNNKKGIIQSGQSLKLLIKIYANVDICNPILGLRIKTITGIDVYAANTRDENIGLENMNAGETYEFEINFSDFNLIQGEYFLSLAIGVQSGDDYIPLDHRIDAINIKVVQSNKATGISNLKQIITMR